MKVIDLIVMKHSNQKMPEHILINRMEYFYDKDRKTYKDETGAYMFIDFSDNVLNMEVEILDSRFDNLDDLWVDKKGFIHSTEGTWKGRKLDILFVGKFNELVRELRNMSETKIKGE